MALKSLVTEVPGRTWSLKSCTIKGLVLCFTFNTILTESRFAVHVGKTIMATGLDFFFCADLGGGVGRDWILWVSRGGTGVTVWVGVCAQPRNRNVVLSTSTLLTAEMNALCLPRW